MEILVILHNGSGDKNNFPSYGYQVVAPCFGDEAVIAKTETSRC